MRAEGIDYFNWNQTVWVAENNGAAQSTVEDWPKPHNDLQIVRRPCGCSLRAHLITVKLIDGAAGERPMAAKSRCTDPRDLFPPSSSQGSLTDLNFQQSHCDFQAIKSIHGSFSSQH